YGSAEVVRGERVVSCVDNYYSLGYTQKEATLSKRYTRYVNQDSLLRTQMTAVIPQVLREYQISPSHSQLWLCPGIVYRRDVVDRTHVGEPHQMDVWYLRK